MGHGVEGRGCQLAVSSFMSAVRATPRCAAVHPLVTLIRLEVFLPLLRDAFIIVMLLLLMSLLLFLFLPLTLPPQCLDPFAEMLKRIEALLLPTRSAVQDGKARAMP